ncbi:MAG TPA: hypothetical protein VL172_07185 [Kofleriaceae bacterium]|jgi:hypothetical protein|nr:hypothetical protein [Kofleriaceae bacterium]
MHASLHTVLVVVAVIAALGLVLESRDRLVAAVALCAAGLEALIAFHLVQVSVRGLSLGLVLAVILLLCGGICWTRTSGKSAITAATLLTVAGALQVLFAMRVVG